MRELKRLEGLVAASFAESDRLLRHCARVDDWPGLFDGAFAQGVAGMLSHRLAAAGFIVPAAAREQAERRFAVDRLWHRRTAADLQRILEVFEGRDLRAVVLKGLVLGERLYPRAMLRPAGDLDLLIAASDVPRAREALATAGFSPRVWRPHETPPTHALMFEHAGGGSLDLHHLASDGFGTTIATGGLIDRSLPYRTEGGGKAWILSAEDELLYLSVHAARHRSIRLGWLVDIKLFIDRHPDLRWDIVGARARAWHVRPAAATTRAMLEKRLRLSLPAPARAALPIDLRTRAALRLAATANDPAKFYSSDTPLPAKTYRIFCDHTFHALLGEGIAAGLGYWWRSMARSAGRLRRRRVAQSR